MSYSIVFRIIGGSFEEGYELEAEIRRNRQIICTERGRLSPETEIPRLYEQTFPVHYSNWGSRSCWGSRVIEDGDGEESRRDCIDTSKQLERIFQNWFRYADLGAIQTRITRNIPPGSAPTVILEANHHRILQCLPWHQWDWLNHEFPHTEIVLSRKAFEVVTSINKRLRVLVVLGSEEGIDLKPDWTALATNLNPIADLVKLPQPSLTELRNQISQGCDILFFAGHSDRNESGDNGWIKINETQTISIDHLIPEFRSAIKKGLKMILLNSCSGMGIASRLSELEIPYMVVMREPIHNDVAGKFIEYCLKDLADGNSLTRAVSQARNKLRELEGKYICASWMPVIFQSREAPDYIPFPRNKLLLHILKLLTQLKTIGEKRMKIPRIVFILIGLIAAFAINYCRPQTPEILESMGTHALFIENQSPAKTDGLAAYSRKDYREAINQFNQALQQHPEDPETRIYLNNASVLENSKNPDLLPVIAVIASPSEVDISAIEILKGEALAQQQKNQDGKTQVLVKIIIDNNNLELAKKVADKLVRDQSIKGVVGHLSSNVSIETAKIYENGGLVAISPSSSSTQLTAQDNYNYIFRSVPNSIMMAKTLANYAVTKNAKTKLGICFNNTLKSGKTFADAFTKAVKDNGGETTPLICDMSAPGFSAHSTLQQMKRQNVKGVLVYENLDKEQGKGFDQVVLIARAASQNGLKLFAPHALIAKKTTTSDFSNMVLVTPRDAAQPEAQEFTSKYRTVFAGETPDWRSLSSFDSLMSIAVGLEQSNGKRAGLAKKLHEPTFSIKGSSGPIKYSKSGDRAVTPSIVQVKCQGTSCKLELMSVAAPKLK